MEYANMVCGLACRGGSLPVASVLVVATHVRLEEVSNMPEMHADTRLGRRRFLHKVVSGAVVGVAAQVGIGIVP